MDAGLRITRKVRWCSLRWQGLAIFGSTLLKYVAQSRHEVDVSKSSFLSSYCSRVAEHTRFLNQSLLRLSTMVWTYHNRGATEHRLEDTIPSCRKKRTSLDAALTIN